MAINIPVLEELREDKITTVVADDLEIKGTIKFKTSVMLKGSFEGEIISEGLLVVGPTAKVAAEITTKTLISHGQIEGNVAANEQCVLKSTATHTGNLVTPFLTIENGAVFNGVAVMERKEEVEEVVQEAEPEPQPQAQAQAQAPQAAPAPQPQAVEPELQAVEPEAVEPSKETEQTTEESGTFPDGLPEELVSVKTSEYKEGSFTSSRHKKHDRTVQGGG